MTTSPAPLVTVEAAFIQQALGCLAITDLVGNRVDPGLSQEIEPVDKPRLLVTRISGPRHQSLTGPTNLGEGRMQFDCIAPTYHQAKSLAQAVRREFDGYRGTMNGVFVQQCLLDDERDFNEASPGTDSRRAFITQLDFMFMNSEEYGNGETA